MSCELYRHFDSAGTLLYVGVSLSSLRRLVSHKNGSPWFNEITSITIERFPSKADAEAAEDAVIERERPKYNQHGTAKPALPDAPDLLGRVQSGLSMRRILAAGHAVLACGGMAQSGRPAKQEPAEATTQGLALV